MITYPLSNSEQRQHAGSIGPSERKQNRENLRAQDDICLRQYLVDADKTLSQSRAHSF